MNSPPYGPVTEPEPSEQHALTASETGGNTEAK